MADIGEKVREFEVKPQELPIPQPAVMPEPAREPVQVPA